MNVEPKPVVEVRKAPRGYPWRVYVDGVWVGTGDETPARALAEELRADDTKARAVVAVVQS